MIEATITAFLISWEREKPDSYIFFKSLALSELYSQSPLIQRDGWVGVSLAAQLDVLSVEVPVSIKPIHRNIWLIWYTHITTWKIRNLACN